VDYKGPLEVGHIIAVRVKVNGKSMLRFPSIPHLQSQTKRFAQVTLIRYANKDGKPAAVDKENVKLVHGSDGVHRRSSSLGNEKVSTPTHRRGVSWGSNGSVAFGFYSPPINIGAGPNTAPTELNGHPN
jgi:hypothetical protein